MRHLVGQFLIPPGKSVSLRKDFDPGYTAEYVRKRDARSLLSRDIERLKDLQDRFYAQKTHALLIILQALDAAGKDSVIKHVISGLNPQGCHVWSFKQPSADELAHDYLWRTSRLLPSRGIIGIFNRSYYEEALVVRVHRELLEREGLPDAAMTHGIWRRRFDEITQFEQYLVDNGVVVLKFFLHVSKEEQRQRFLKRIERADKNWKFSANDVHQRAYWDAYMGCLRRHAPAHEYGCRAMVCRAGRPQVVHPLGRGRRDRRQTGGAEPELSVTHTRAATRTGRRAYAPAT